MNCCQILAVILVNVLALPLQILALPFQLLFILLMWEAQIAGVSRKVVVPHGGGGSVSCQTVCGGSRPNAGKM